jgi:hypothetical protein
MRSDEVSKRLGLSWKERAALAHYLGNPPCGIPAGIKANAQSAETQIEDIRNRYTVDLALHKLACPTTYQGGRARSV